MAIRWTSFDYIDPGFVVVRVYHHKELLTLRDVGWLFLHSSFLHRQPLLMMEALFFSERIASPPKTKKYGVAWVVVLTVVL